MKKIIYQGAKGCFSELAAKKFFNVPLAEVGVPTFEDIFEMAHNEDGVYGIIPIENSLTGSIHQNYDLLLKYDLSIIGEVELKITYNLFANQGVLLESIKEIWSHPVALDQCKQFLSMHPGYKVVSVYDSAGAAKIVSEEQKRDIAVIAGPQVEKLYGLKTLKEKVEDNCQNFTRFLVISHVKEIATGKDVKTTLVFTVKNEPGVLFRCLSIFALRNIDLVKLESRPIIGKPWEYMFYIDFKGSIADENCRRAVETLGEVAAYFKFLGSYTIHPATKFEGDARFQDHCSITNQVSAPRN